MLNHISRIAIQNFCHCNSNAKMTALVNMQWVEFRDSVFLWQYYQILVIIANTHPSFCMPCSHNYAIISFCSVKSLIRSLFNLAFKAPLSFLYPYCSCLLQAFSIWSFQSIVQWSFFEFTEHWQNSCCNTNQFLIQW